MVGPDIFKLFELREKYHALSPLRTIPHVSSEIEKIKKEMNEIISFVAKELGYKSGFTNTYVYSFKDNDLEVWLADQEDRFIVGIKHGDKECTTILYTDFKDAFSYFVRIARDILDDREIIRLLCREFEKSRRWST